METQLGKVARSTKPEEFKEIYECLGYKPSRLSFFESGRRCCPLSALYMDKVLDPYELTSFKKKNLDRRFKAIAKEYKSDNYCRGFISGFDGDDTSSLMLKDTDSREFKRGRNKGTKVANILGV